MPPLKSVTLLTVAPDLRMAVAPGWIVQLDSTAPNLAARFAADIGLCVCSESAVLSQYPRAANPSVTNASALRCVLHISNSPWLHPRAGITDETNDLTPAICTLLKERWEELKSVDIRCAVVPGMLRP